MYDTFCIFSPFVITKGRAITRDQIKKRTTSVRFHTRYYTTKFDKNQQETWGQINYTGFFAEMLDFAGFNCSREIPAFAGMT